MNKRFLLLIFLISFASFGQRLKQERYKNFDKRLFHFGFMLGFNTADFTVYQEVNAYNQYGLVSLQSESSPGGQLGMLATMKLGTPVLRLRFLPTLSFQERILRYQSLDSFNFKKGVGEERVNSTNVDFPLMLQFRTKRFNNFTAYALFGAQYSIDLQSQEKASQNYIDPFVKIKRNDFQGQIGGGVEFFAPFFKVGLELKYSHGFKSSFVQDNTPVSNPINQLYNKGWWFSIIFEG
ncbi:MAG: PorT family protein [Flavobacteriales bacterium]|nr:PorT family protein [Flavobacteriales bacterium]